MDKDLQNKNVENKNIDNKDLENEDLLKVEEEGIFTKYPSMSLTAEKILNSFMDNNKKLGGFFVDDEPGDSKSKVGIISDCMALSTFLELNSMEANIVPHYKRIFKLVESIANSIYRNGNGEDCKPYYDATPYVFNSPEKGIEIDSYVETISKVLITFTDLRDFVLVNKLEGKKIKYELLINGLQINSADKMIEIIEKVIVDCIATLNDACLDNENVFAYKIDDEPIKRNKLSEEVKHRGWTFKNAKQDEEKDYSPSIYYTYHVSNAYLSFFQSFEKYFYDEFGDIEELEFTINEFNKVEVEKDRLNKEFFTNNLKLISEFRYCVVSSGRYFEHLITKNNADIAFDFLNKDLTPVSLDVVMNSQDNNYVMNTLLVLATLINAGTDDDYWFKDKKDYFYEQINYSLNNIKKIYNYFKRLNREEFIDSYTLVLDEKFPTSCNAVIKELRRRCKNTELYGLIPLYCNTYAVVSKYLVRFPQKEMNDIYYMIMENKMDDEDGWLWSSTGYNINNNLYYIFALENFYKYYFEYESPLIEADITRAKYEKLKANFEKEKQKEIALILKEHSKELAQKDLEINKVKELLENKRSKLDEEVLNLLNNNIEKVMTKYLEDLVYQTKMHALISWKIANGDYTGIEEYEDREQREKLLASNTKAQLLYEMAFSINNLEEIEKINSNEGAGKTPEQLYKTVDEKIKNKIKEKTKAR